MIDRSNWPATVTIKQLVELVGISETVLYARVRAGEFPDRHKGAMGAYWRTADLTDHMLRSVTIRRIACPQCSGKMTTRGTSGKFQLRKCVSCGHSVRLDDAGNMHAAKKLSPTFFPACSCGGKILVTSFNSEREYKYGTCKDCGGKWKMHKDGSGFCKSDPLNRAPRVVKPKQPKPKKVETVAKSLNGVMKEKIQTVQRIRSQEIGGPVRAVVDPTEKIRREQIAAARERQEARRLEKELYGW